MLEFLAVFMAISSDRCMGQVRPEKGCCGHFLAVFVQPANFVCRLDEQVRRLKGTVGAGSSNRPTYFLAGARACAYTRVCVRRLFFTKLLLIF